MNRNSEIRYPTRIAILLTCHNRKPLTDRCLNSIFNNIPKRAIIDVYLVDDGCTDGTSEMIRIKYPAVKLLHGDGNLFWNRGMHRAFSEAVKGDYEYYLWINDDDLLYDGFLDKMLKTHEMLAMNNKKVILAGVMTDSSEKIQTYGGTYIIPSLIPLKMGQRKMEDKPVSCDTFHGNCVLIHKSVVDTIGIIDPFYQHAFGDADYGLRATRNGCGVWVTNYDVGICVRHDGANKWLDPKLSFKERLKDYHKKTANPTRDWKYFCKKFCGWNWWIRYIAPDIKIFIQSALKK